MSHKVYNKLILKGKPEDIKVLIDGCYGNPLKKDGTISEEINVTFNSYIKVNSIEEAIEKWGVAEDSLMYYDVSFIEAKNSLMYYGTCLDEAKKGLESYSDNAECEVGISFQTYNGVVFKWVKAMAKANPKINIKYYVTDTVRDFYSACEFDINTDNIEYKVEKYESGAELEYKFLNHSLEDLMKHKINYGEFMMDTGKDDFKFNINDIMDYLREEFKFLSDDDFKALIDKVA